MIDQLKIFLYTGTAESLKKLLSDTDLTVRQKATECLFVIGGVFSEVIVNNITFA